MAAVDELIDSLGDQVPALMREAGVTAIVSKWDKQGLAKYESAEKVDVTMLLVHAFNPDPKHLKMAEDIQKQPPMASDELEEHFKKDSI